MAHTELKSRVRQRLRNFVKPGRLLSDELIAERRRAAFISPRSS